MVNAAELREFIRSTLNLKDITPDAAMGRVRGWDSLKHVSLVLALEQRYQVKVPVDRIGELTSVSALTEFYDQAGLIGADT